VGSVWSHGRERRATLAVSRLDRMSVVRDSEPPGSSGLRDRSSSSTASLVALTQTALADCELDFDGAKRQMQRDNQALHSQARNLRACTEDDEWRCQSRGVAFRG